MTKYFHGATARILILVLGGWLLFSNSLFSQQNNPLVTARSAEFALSAQASDENIAIGIIDITEAALDYFYRMMGTTKGVEVVCSYRWRDGADKPIPDIYPSFLKIGKGFEIEGFGDLKNEKVKEALIRTSMIVFLQTMVASEKKFQNGETIAYPPLWLMEGLTQGMMEMRREKFEQIIQRTAAVRKTPALKTIQQWKEFSSSKIEKFWQQAFCYWAVNFATQSVPDQERLRSWVQYKLSDLACSDYWGESEEPKWLQNQTPPDRSPMMSWEATCARLDEILMEKNLGQHVRKLTELQMQGHFLLQDAMDLYIEAYSLQGENREAKLAEARKQRGVAEFAMQSARQRLDDIIMNYTIGGEGEKMSGDDELLDKYARKPIDDVFKKRLNIYEMKMRGSSRK